MDLINGMYELFGALFILPSIVKLAHEKQVKGVSWIHAGFFVSWGYWNLIYYPSLGQTMSFYGGALLTAANTFWFGQMVYYSRRPSINVNR